ncbi:MAG: HAD family phosphatase [Candidatus Methanofastidiosa archaeon]|nr:HAD family phosphatase [Candidatus Methanofastidiosa archaeon]
MEYYIFFDMDGVLTPQAQALQLAETIGKRSLAMKIFAGQLRKQVGLEWILSKGVKFITGQPSSILKETAQKMLVTKSAKDTIRQLKEASYRPIIITNGFEELARFFGKRIGIEEVYGNSPEAKEGILTGNLSDTKLLTLKSKGDFVRNYLRENGIDRNRAIAVGNDENDMFMFKEVGLSIVFNPSGSIKRNITNSFSKAMDGRKKEFVKFTNMVDIVILENDLSKILPFLVPEPNKFSKNVKIDEITRI